VLGRGWEGEGVTHFKNDRYQSDLDRWAREEDRLDWFVVVLVVSVLVLVGGWV